MDLSTPPETILAHALARYSKRELAQLLDVNPVTVGRWELGSNISRRDRLALLYLLDTPRPVREPEAHFTFVDLFAGIGGFRLGFEDVDGRCVFTCEWDEKCQRTYRENFRYDERKIWGDIATITRPDRYGAMRDDELR